jgi:hypothetical protein
MCLLAGANRPCGENVEQTANRRKNSRHRLHCPVRIREKGLNAELAATVSDVSLDGCYIETLQPFPMGARLLLTISHEELEICVQGTVCSVHPRMGMGISFNEVDSKNRERLERVVTTQKERGVGDSF